MQIKINTMNPSHCHSTTYSHFHYNHLLLHRSENSSLIPLCVLVCSFFVSFIFCIFIPKILFCFLKKVILVRCWEKYRPLINSTLSGYKTAVSSSGMQDHLLASPSSVLGGIPIPTVSTLTQAQGRSFISQACRHQRAGYTPPSILTEGVERGRGVGRCKGKPSPVLSIQDWPKFHSENSLFYL